MGSAAFGRNGINFQYAYPNNIDEVVNKWLDDGKDKYFRALFITDLSVNEETADRLDKIDIPVVVLDHHEGVEDTNPASDKYDWFVEGDSQYSACKLTYFYLLHYDGVNPAVLQPYEGLADAIQSYDLWTWVANNDDYPRKLDILLRMIGRLRFIDRFAEDHSTTLSPSEEGLVTVWDELSSKYCKRKYYDTIITNASIIDGGFAKVAYVSADEYINDLASYLDKKFPDVDAIMINNGFSMSIRSEGSDYAVRIAQAYGGNGHKESAGFKLSDKVKDEAQRTYLDKSFYNSTAKIEDETPADTGKTIDISRVEKK